MRWPEISIAKWQLQEVSGVGAYYDRCDLVREWHFWPLGSERLRRGYWEGRWMGFVGGFGKR
jgi:hypothetical protein